MKSTLKIQNSITFSRRSPVMQNCHEIDDSMQSLSLSIDFAYLKAAHQFVKHRILPVRRRFGPTMKICFGISTLTDSAFKMLRCLSYDTLRYFSSLRLYRGSVKALRAGAVNRKTTSHCWQAHTTLSGRNLTPSRRCALC